MSAIEDHELQQAALVWGDLSQELREQVLHLHANDGIAFATDWFKRMGTSLADRGPIIRHALRDKLIDLGIASEGSIQAYISMCISGHSGPTESRPYGREAAYVLTKFGDVVARYGTAARVVERATGNA